MQSPTEATIEILQYKTNVGYFYKVNGESTSTFIFNGFRLNELKQKNGFFVLDLPLTKVEKKVSGGPRKSHYELREEIRAISLLPRRLELDQVFSMWDELEETETLTYDGHNVTNFYEKKYITDEPKISEVKFKIIDCGEYKIDNPFDLKSRKISYLSRTSYKDSVIKTELADLVNYDQFTDLLTPEFAKEQVDCYLSSKQMFGIVRQYIKENLDFKQSRIIRDYDFAFVVYKIVKVKEYLKKVPGRKAIKVDEKQIRVFEMTYSGYEKSGKGYGDYTPICEMHGSSVEDLYNKLTEFLEGLISQLNTPVVECECCGGVGFHVKKD